MEIHGDLWWSMTWHKRTATKKDQFIIKKEEKRNVQTWFRQCKENSSKRFMIVTGFCCNEKLKIRWVEKMLKSTQNTIKRMFYIQYLQKKFQSFIPMTFIEGNFIKTKQATMLQKVTLHPLNKCRLIQELGM